MLCAFKYFLGRLTAGMLTSGHVAIPCVDTVSILVSVAVVFASILVHLGAVQLTECDALAQKPSATADREIHRDEVAKHRSKDSVWVTYKDGVYDVTDFAAMHPGGASRLMLAAGGAIDPFWAMYAQHQTAEVRQLLENYRIGTLVRCRHQQHLLHSALLYPTSYSPVAAKLA